MNHIALCLKLVAVILASLPVGVSAFVRCRPAASAMLEWTISRAREHSKVLQAYVYGMDPTEDPENFSSDDLLGLDSLGKERAKLARVVAAFPPSDHSLALKDIADINILEVDGTHIDLQATVCEKESCAAIEVPVIFPHPCDVSANLNECVWQNLDDLDHEAELKLKQDEWEATNYELHEEMNRQRRDLTNERVQLPHWWVPSNLVPGMASECDSMRNLLNDAEFQSEILAIANSGLGHPKLFVEEAVVSIVGPAGMVLKGRLQGGEVTQISFPFPCQAASIDQLRDLVEQAIQMTGK